MRLLIAEDNEGLRRQYQWSITGFELLFASEYNSAMQVMTQQQPELVLLDLGLPPDPDNASEGLRLLSDILQKSPDTKVIVLTGSSQHAHALEATRLGAFDYQQKGLSPEALQFALERAATMQRLAVENRRNKENACGISQNVIGNSVGIRNAYRNLSLCAPMPVSVLLHGESGTGKEVFAKALHDLSGRTGDFIAINCASIPKELLESELFGHERGAFTGANRKKSGKVMLADKGTLFLDEIGDMPTELQAKLLRFLQERVIEPVGSEQSIPVDVRVVCATHRNLSEMTEQGGFRMDLFFRLAEFQLNIPALREREGDVLLLARHFLSLYRSQMNIYSQVRASEFSESAELAMLEHSWPGNIRELQNKIKAALITANGPLIVPSDLHLKEPSLTPSASVVQTIISKTSPQSTALSLEDIRKAADAHAAASAYDAAKGNVSEAAKILQVTRKTMYRLLRLHNLISPSEEHEDAEDDGKD